MKIKFSGLEGYDELTLRGITFKKGKAVEIKEGEFLTRLLNLDYFKEVKARKNDKNSPASSN